MKTIHWMMAATLIAVAPAQAADEASLPGGEEVIVTLASQDPLPSEEAADQLFDDTIITANVVAALVEDNRIDALNLAVETQEGVVSLSGSAASEDERRRAIELASNIYGVCDVRDNIQLQR